MPLSETTKHAVDAASVTTTIGALAGWLPALAALVSIVWGCIRIYETQTVQRLLQRDGGGHGRQ